MIHGKLSLILYSSQQLEQLGLCASYIMPTKAHNHTCYEIDLLVSTYLFEEGDGSWEETAWNLRTVDKDWIYLTTVNKKGGYVSVVIRKDQLLGFKQHA